MTPVFTRPFCIFAASCRKVTPAGYDCFPGGARGRGTCEDVRVARICEHSVVIHRAVAGEPET